MLYTLYLLYVHLFAGINFFYNSYISSLVSQTIEAMCYKQEFTSCLKTKEERLLELPMDANIPILATIGKTKEQGYNFGTLEQVSMACIN